MTYDLGYDKVTILSASPEQHCFVICEDSPGKATALAWSNAFNQDATVILRAVSTTGQRIVSSPYIVGPYEHKAAFIFELLPLPAGFQGTVEVESNRDLFLVALQLNDGQISAVGLLPVSAVYDFQASDGSKTFRGMMRLSIRGTQVSGSISVQQPTPADNSQRIGIMGIAKNGSAYVTTSLFAEQGGEGYLLVLMATNGFATWAQNVSGTAFFIGDHDGVGVFTATKQD